MVERKTSRLWRFGLACLLVLAAIGALIVLRGRVPSEHNRPHFDRGEIAFLTAEGVRIPFQVEIARTSDQHAYGLMFQRSMPQGHGMLFVFNPPEQVAFWMKNTLMPLDIIYVRSDGRIAQIIAQAVPLDETPLPSHEKIAYVVEIGGGEAQRLHLQEGDALTVDE